MWTTGGAPAEAVSRLEGEMRKVLASPEFVAAIQITGVTITNLGSGNVLTYSDTASRIDLDQGRTCTSR